MIDDGGTGKTAGRSKNPDSALRKRKRQAMLAQLSTKRQSLTMHETTNQILIELHCWQH